jgi:hypothetical protein
MAASGFTPIQLYYSVTSTNVPLAANLVYGELALNAADGKMYYKSTAGGGTVVKIADAATATGSVLGGTAGALVYQSAPSTSAFVNIGTSTYILTSNGTVPVYTNPASITVGLATLATSATTAVSATTATFATSATTAVSATTATTATNLAGGTANRLAYQSAAGTTTFAPAPSTVGYVLGWSGSAFTWVVAPAAVSAIDLTGGGANTIVYQSATGTTAYLTNGTTGQVLGANTGAAPTWGVPTAATNIANGTAGQIVYQSAPSTTAFAGPGTSGQALVSNGATAPTFGTLPIAGGGTNSTATPTAGGVVYGTGTAQAYSAVGTTGQALVSAGASAPAFGTLGVAGGGTGQTTAAAAFTALAPSQGGNSGKYLTTNGTSASWAAAGGIAQVTTATTATTLTSTPTLLQITPASYGVTVTLPDATTCPVGGPLHCIDNRGAYPVRIANTSGTLLGFVFAGVVSYINLDNNSTAAGVWAISSNELVGASAQLLTTTIQTPQICIDLGSGKEMLISCLQNLTAIYGVVYDKTTNTFGSSTLLRTVTMTNVGSYAACLSGANQVLMVSCSSTTAFEAVALSVSGTTITVNTAATATLSANIATPFFADGCGLIAVGSSFVTSYTVATPAAQIRALSISGTTVTIGAATVLGGTAGGLIAASGSYVIAVSTETTSIYTRPHLVSGSTLTTGTGTTTTTSTQSLVHFSPLGTRWYVGHVDGTGARGSVVSLTATGNGTTTISTATTLGTVGITIDAIVVGSNKVLVLATNYAGPGNANILTDTAGTASAGTAITLDSGTAKAALFVSGTDVYVGSFQTYPGVHRVDCSGASPVLTSSTRAQTNNGNLALTSVSNAVLSRSASKVYGTNFAQIIVSGTAGQTSILTVNASGLSQRLSSYPQNSATLTAEWAPYRGKSNSERWCGDGSTVITKMECVA